MTTTQTLPKSLKRPSPLRRIVMILLNQKEPLTITQITEMYNKKHHASKDPIQLSPYLSRLFACGLVDHVYEETGGGRWSLSKAVKLSKKPTSAEWLAVFEIASLQLSKQLTTVCTNKENLNEKI